MVPPSFRSDLLSWIPHATSFTLSLHFGFRPCNEGITLPLTGTRIKLRFPVWFRAKLRGAFHSNYKRFSPTIFSLTAFTVYSSSSKPFLTYPNYTGHSKKSQDISTFPLSSFPFLPVFAESSRKPFPAHQVPPPIP